MAVQLLGLRTKFTDDQGRPLVGGKVHTFYSGTCHPKDTYKDPAKKIPNTNPVILDDTGSADIFLDGSYLIRICDKNCRIIEEQDNVRQPVGLSEMEELGFNLSEKIESVKLDTGITVTPKFTGSVARILANKNIETISPEDFKKEADGDDWTNAFNLMFQNCQGKVISLSNKIYNVKSIKMPDNTCLHANGATLKRISNTYKAVISTGKHCLVTGLSVDGNEPVLLKQLWNGDDGIYVDEYSTVLNCKSHNNHGHGIILRSNSTAICCQAFDNGLEGSNGPKWGNWGDGINFTNSKNVVLIKCTTWNNYRTGIVGTTGGGSTLPDGSDWIEDPNLSAGYLVIGCKSYGNYYSDTNFEGVGRSIIESTDMGKTTFSKSANLTINNSTAINIYADNTNNVTVRDITMLVSNATGAFFLRGKNPVVTGLKVLCQEGKGTAGAAVEVYEVGSSSGILRDVHIEKGSNLGVRTDVANVSGIDVIEPTGYRLNYMGAPNYNSSSASDNFEVENSVVTYTSGSNIAIPTSGKFLRGTTILSGNQDDPYYAVVCTKSGDFSTSTPPSFKLVKFNNNADLSRATSALPSSIKSVNDYAALANTHYWLEGSIAGLPPASNSSSAPENKATIKTFNGFRTSGNYSLVQEVYYTKINEKWTRCIDMGATTATEWKKVF